VNLPNPSGSELEPAPVSPCKDSAEFNLLSGTIKAVWNAGKSTFPLVPRDARPIRLPDAANYWKLSKNIYRYNHKNGLDKSVPSGVHTINESEYTENGVLEVLGLERHTRYIGRRAIGDDQVLHGPHPQR